MAFVLNEPVITKMQPTMKIVNTKGKGGLPFLIINRSDFDSSTMQEYTGEVPVAIDVLAGMSAEQLVAHAMCRYGLMLNKSLPVEHMRRALTERAEQEASA